jgi:hypothetical protein
VVPVANKSGVVTITLTVSDGSDTGTSSFDLTVNPINDPPTISDITDQSIIGNHALSDFGFTVTDPDGDTVTVTGASSNDSLVPDASVVVGGSGQNRTVTVTPVLNESGTTTITLSADDGNGGTDTETFVLTVVDQQPIAVDDSVDLLGALSADIDVLGNDSGIGNVPVTVTIATVLDPLLEGTATVNPDGSIHLVLGALAAGDFTFDYTVTDADGDSDTGTVSITLF